MANLITISSMRRSGHHAILEWLLAQFTAQGHQTFHFNDRTNNFFLGNIAWMPTVIRPPDPEDKRVICINWEDCFLKGITYKSSDSCAYQCYNCLVLRDPFNCMASRWAKNLWPRIDMWKAYAREFIGLTNFIPDKVCIAYNHWLDDRDYRENIAKLVGVKFTDAGFGQHPASLNSGSSFDSKTTPISEMKFTERWKRYENHSEYLKLWKDQELWELSEKIFGVIPDTHSLRR